MANNYIPGFTPSLHGRPVKRMAIGGRMEGNRAFRERDDTIDFEAVGNPLGNLQNTLSNIDANAVLANYNNSVGSTAADTYQSLPTEQPVQTVAYEEPAATYSFPTPQPVQTVAYNEPAATYSFPAPQPTTAVPLVDYTEPSATSLPDAQPAQTVASSEYAPLDLGNWNPSMVNLGSLNLVSDPGPAYDPNSVVRFDTGAKIGVPDASGGFTYQNAAPVVAQPGTTYTLTDYNGNILGRGSTVEEIQKLVALADQNALRGWNLYKGDPVAGGQLFERSPQDNTLKNMLIAGATAMGAGFLGPYIQGAGAIAPGAVGAAATPLGAGLAAGAVNTAANLATGANIVDALKSGAMAGLSSAAMTGLLGGGKTPNIGDIQMNNIDALTALGVNPELAGQIASGTVSNIGSAAGSFGGTGGGGAAGSALGGSDAVNNLIQVIGSKGASNIPTSLLTSALGAASGALSGVNYGDQVWNRPAAQEAEVREPGSNEYDPANKEIVVKSGKYKVDFDPKSILNKFLNADYMGTPDYEGLKDLIDRYNNMYDIEYPYDDEGWTVEGAKKLPRVIPPTAALPDLFPPLNSVDIPTDLVKEWPEIPTTDNEIVVTAPKPKLPGVVIPPFILPGTPSVPTTQPTQPADQTKPTDEKKSDLDKIIDKIKAATTVAGLVGAGAAAAGSGKKSSFSAARGPLNPIFSAKLPKPNMRMAMPRALNFDAYRYGYGPEQSFFTNVPQGALNTSTAYTGYDTSPRYNATEQYASNFAALAEAIRKAREEEELKREEEALAAANALGLTGYAEGGFAVGGPGDGRDDKIPAMLSDGEYVIDAETVAMLGNGSNKAGAEALDKLRVNVRKHKGRQLSKGKFSVNAKKPEQYLKGRK